jgi:hypothetical protein
MLVDATHLSDGHSATVSHDERHLQYDTESVSDVVHIELIERLGAVTPHKQEPIAICCCYQLLVQLSTLQRITQCSSVGCQHSTQQALCSY